MRQKLIIQQMIEMIAGGVPGKDLASVAWAQAIAVELAAMDATEGATQLKLVIHIGWQANPTWL